MGFTKQNNLDFFLKDNRLVLSEEYMSKNKNRFKKITGTRFASVLGKNGFSSPTKIWAIMTNIYVEPMMDELYAKAGNIIEPKIHAFVCQKLGINFKQYNPYEIKWDVFKENPIFGGIPDGEPIDVNGKLLYPDAPMLEIKTTSIDSFVFKNNKGNFVLQKNAKGEPLVKKVGEKKEKWFSTDGEIEIPMEYKFQLGLYCYLRNISKGIFAVCFLETCDYTNPDSCNVNERDVRIVDFSIDLKEFKKYIDYATKWYHHYIDGGTSPELSTADKEWFANEIR